MHVRTSRGRVERFQPALQPGPILAGLAAVALAPASVALLGGFPPLEVHAVDAEWLLPSLGGLSAAVTALAMVLGLARGLAAGLRVELGQATALGILAAGLATASLQGAVRAEDFPSPSLALAATVAAAVLLAAQLLDGTPGGQPLRRAGLAWLTAFFAIEAALAAGLFLPVPDGAVPWLFAAAAAMFAAAAWPGPWLAAGLLAAGSVALAAARPGTIEAVPGMASLGAGALAYALLTRRDDAEAPEDRRPGVEPDPAESRPSLGAVLAAADDEALRLARELRGTIDELLHARRTIELQREEIARAASEDALTGVATRRAILDRLRIEAAGARRYGHPVALVLLDLDGFAELNGRHGTRVGDEVLREVGLRLRLRIRAADGLGRVGADSFLALLPHTDEGGAATFADALRRRLVDRPIATSAGELRPSVSIGVAFMRPGMALTDEELLAAADEALASARAAGGNRIAFDRLHGLIRLEDRREPGEAAGATS